MAGIPIVVSVGAPSSLGVQVAKEFDITLIGGSSETTTSTFTTARNVFLGKLRTSRSEVKLRINGNSIRLRLLRSEVVAFMKTGRIEQTIHFAPVDYAVWAMG
jgi:hypothetical protein